LSQQFEGSLMPPNALKAVALVLTTPTIVALISLLAYPQLSGREVLFAIWLYVGLPTLLLACFLLWVDRPSRSK
jgi:hypothetical protein